MAEGTMQPKYEYRRIYLTIRKTITRSSSPSPQIIAGSFRLRVEILFSNAA